MTGNGTQETPYVPESWQDFVTACETSRAYVSVPQGTVYEFNEIAPAGFSGTIAVKALKIEGNGLIINNLRKTGNTFLSVPYGAYPKIYDINFTNMYFTSGTFSYTNDNYNSAIYFYHCRFSGEFYRSSIFCSGGKHCFEEISGTDKGCSLNLKFAENSVFHSSSKGVSIYNGNVKLSGESAGQMRTIYAYDSQFTGKIPFSSVAFQTADRCIFDMDIKNISSNGGTSVLNSDKLTGTQSGFLTADSKQIRNAEYLRNLGFPIGVS